MFACGKHVGKKRVGTHALMGPPRLKLAAHGVVISHTHTHTHAHTHTHTNLGGRGGGARNCPAYTDSENIYSELVHVLQACSFVWFRVFLSLSLYVRACVYVCACARARARVCVCVCACVCVCVCDITTPCAI